MQICEPFDTSEAIPADFEMVNVIEYGKLSPYKGGLIFLRGEEPLGVAILNYMEDGGFLVRCTAGGNDVYTKLSVETKREAKRFAYDTVIDFFNGDGFIHELDDPEGG
jgi:hypothetical protein